MISIVSFLDRVFSLIQVLLKKIQEKRAQDERDSLEANPADWFNEHFDGVSDTSNETETSQANTNYPAK